MAKQPAWERQAFEGYLSDFERKLKRKPGPGSKTLAGVFGRHYRKFLWARFAKYFLPALRALHAGRPAGSRPFPKAKRKKGRVLGPPMSRRPRAHDGEWLPIVKLASRRKQAGPPPLRRRR